MILPYGCRGLWLGKYHQNASIEEEKSIPLFFLFLPGECNKALGMESGEIPHEAITASSSHADVVGPHVGRYEK